jgi:hypothetical protein
LWYNQPVAERELELVNQVILIDRRKYVVGLFWQPVASGITARNYAKVLTRGVDKRLNKYTEYRAMVGLGFSRAGHHVGMASAAAEVMEAFAEYSSFLAVFKTGEFYWLVAVRNGIIIQDQLFDTEDAARSEYTKLSTMPDWGSLFAPSIWGMPRSVERRLEDVITGNVRATLKPISHFKTSFFSLVLLVAFVLGTAYFFREPISQMLIPKSQISEIDPVLAEEYKKRIEEKNKELDQRFEIKKAEPIKPLEMPYDYLPDPAERGWLCYQAVAFLMQQIPGWVQTEAECGDTHATAVFRRTYGTLEDFYNIATELMPGAFVTEKTESEIVVQAKLPTLRAYSSQEEKDSETIVREVNTAFQKIDTPVDTNLTVDVISDGARSVSLNVVEVGVSSKLTPPEFTKVFSDLRGVYMTRVAWEANGRIWNYEVIIYAK